MYVQLSTDLFWGFAAYVDETVYESPKEMVLEVKRQLINFLKSKNLQVLADKANELQLYYHENEFPPSEIYKNEIVYLCDSCHCHSK
jgi:hypothetical protein